MPQPLDDEIRSHIEHEADENVARGMSRPAAEAAARRKFGNVTRVREDIWRQDTWAWWDGLRLDLRHALRLLRRGPAFTAIALLSLALGIGGNAALFSLIDRLMLRSLSVAEPERLYQMVVTHRSATHNSFSYPDYVKASSGAFEFFEGVFGWSDFDQEAEWNGTKRRVRTLLVTGDYFTTLGVQPAAGRLFQRADDTPQGASTAVLGHGFWQRDFGADPSVVGRTFRVGGRVFTIAGVAPAGFTGVETGPPFELAIPMHAMKILRPENDLLEQTGNYWIRLMARLSPSYTPEQVKPILLARWPQLLEVDGPPPNDGWRQKLTLAPGNSGYSGVRDEFGYALWLLMALAAIVLFTCCANLANLLLLKAEARRREIGVRAAAGATSGRIVRQWLTESLLLALAGGALGVLSARWITNGLLVFIDGPMRDFLAFRLDTRTLLFCFAATLATALFFGAVPAWRASRDSNWREAARGSGGGRVGWAGRTAITAQLAASLVLVAGAALFVRSLQNLAGADPGFRRDNLAVAELGLEDRTLQGEPLDRVYAQFLDRVRATPGVESAGAAFFLPLSGRAWWNPLATAGYVPAQGERTTTYLNAVSPGYFAAMGIPLLAGREFDERDARKAPRVAIVSESVARRYFAGADPLGRKCSIGATADPQDLTIVGVVANSKYTSLREEPKDLLYVPLSQRPYSYRAVVAVRPKTGMTSAAILPSLRGTGAGNNVAAWEYSEQFTRTLQQDRMLAALAMIFGALGAALALVGLYGTMAYSVSRRTGELGIRIALGGHPWRIRWMVAKEAAVLAGLGLAAGLPVAAAASRLVAGRLYEVGTVDGWALGAVAMVMLGVAIGSALVPAVRASRVDPATALRSDAS